MFSLDSLRLFYQLDSDFSRWISERHCDRFLGDYSKASSLSVTDSGSLLITLPEERKAHLWSLRTHWGFRGEARFPVNYIPFSDFEWTALTALSEQSGGMLGYIHGVDNMRVLFQQVDIFIENFKLVEADTKGLS